LLLGIFLWRRGEKILKGFLLFEKDRLGWAVRLVRFIGQCFIIAALSHLWKVEIVCKKEKLVLNFGSARRHSLQVEGLCGIRVARNVQHA